MAHPPAHDFYRLTHIRSTPYPTRLLEASIMMPEPQLKLVNFLVRATLGWHGGPPGTRRASAVCSIPYLRRSIPGTSVPALQHAIDTLISSGIIEVIDRSGKLRLARTWYQCKYLRFKIARIYVEEPD